MTAWHTSRSAPSTTRKCNNRHRSYTAACVQFCLASRAAAAAGTSGGGSGGGGGARGARGAGDGDGDGGGLDRGAKQAATDRCARELSDALGEVR